MDPLLLVPGIVAFVAILVTTIILILPSYRRRETERAKVILDEARESLAKVETTSRQYLSSSEYIPERIGRPLRSEVTILTERTLPSFAKMVERSHDNSMKEEFEAIAVNARHLRQAIMGHNYEFTRRAIAEHSRLLVDELRLDASQREATACDDERNLVIAAAGSGKTRTLIARIRYLLECAIEPRQILAVTFTDKATEEMRDRLKQMGVALANEESAGVTVATLHALGKRAVESAMPGPVSVADSNWAETLVAASLRDAREARDQRLAALYFNAIRNFHRSVDELTPDLSRDLTYRTLRGEHVRSIGERIIADFLFTHQIPYKYEAKAEWAQVGPTHDAYHPDFTLLENGVCVEYWGINREGKVPGTWVTSTERYNQGMTWKRQEFNRLGKKLIEFYDYERKEGTLEAVLEQRLAAAGIVSRPMSLESLQQVLGNTKYIGSAIEQLLVQFIANARSLRLTRDSISKRLASSSPRVHYFGLLGIAVLERYERDLVSEGRIDFSDMLHRASDILEKGSNPLTGFSHILVDEFQDVSASMARLVKALLAANNARLFAVGDDWQAIYGFAGGDIDHIVNFESHFGPATSSMLNVNYRSPSLIVEAGSALISHNSKQIPKQIAISTKERGEAYIHEVPDDDFAVIGETVRVLQDERQREKLDDILILSRTNFILERVKEICHRNMIPVANPDRNLSGVRVMSAHKAKGLEAKVVIVVNASDHLFGFPCRVENPDVLEPVRMSPGNDAAEERRLFYVALTRAMKRIHLILRHGLPSPYIAEIEGVSTPTPRNGFPVIPPGIRFSELFFVNEIYELSDHQVKAGIKQRGVLTSNRGRFSFTSWMGYRLETGSTYWLSGVLTEPPYRDMQQIKLDRQTRVERRIPHLIKSGEEDVRQLRPRPPPSFQPHRIVLNDSIRSP